jgi:flagellar hook-associated protein 2
MDGISGLSPEFQKAYQATVQAERKPIEQIERRKESVETKVNLLQDLIGRVDGLRQVLPGLNTPFTIRELALNSDDPKVVTGSADKNVAEPGKHPLEVLQLAGTASALSNALPDRDETSLGTGYISFDTWDGDTKEIFIDAENATLDGIAKTINNSRIGIRASVVNDSTDPEAPFRLLISTSGIGQTSDVEFPEFYFSGGEEDLFMEMQRDATNAIVRYQGFEIQSPTNEIKDLVPGATLNLKGITDAGKPTTVTIEQDIPRTTTKVKDLVDKTNQILSFIQEQNTMDANTDTSRTLGGEYSINLAQEKIRSALRENFLGDETRMVRALSDVGIEFTKNGILKFDEKKFEHVIEANYNETIDLIAGDAVNYGVITKLSQALNNISRSGSGVLTNQRDNLKGRLGEMDKQIAIKEKAAEHRTQQLKQSLAKAQAALEAMQNQSGHFQGGGGLPGLG